MVLKTFEAFAGYKSQELALDLYGVPNQSVGISEIEPDPIIAACAIRFGNDDGSFNYPDIAWMRDELKILGVGWDFKNKKSRINRMPVKKLKQLYRATTLLKNYGDISNLMPEYIPDHHVFTYSYPCQDISGAGKGGGFKEGSGTRSSLLWECKKIIEVKRPRALMMENVKKLVSKAFMPDFQAWLDYLESLGYNNYWKVVNGNECGIPQNRERVFCVSILKEYDFGLFAFDEPFDSGLRLKDLLEPVVDEKYYIPLSKSKELIDRYIARYGEPPKDGSGLDPTKSKEFGLSWTKDGTAPCQRAGRNGLSVVEVVGNTHPSGNGMNGLVYSENGAIGTLTTNKGEGPKVLQAVDTNKIELVGNLTNGFGAMNIVHENGIAKCFVANGGGNTEPKVMQIIKKENPFLVETDEGVLVRVATEEGYQLAQDGDSVNLSYPDSPSQRGRRGDQEAHTITCQCQQAVVIKKYGVEHDGVYYLIRKLTPRECGRLMGLSDDVIDRIVAAGISNTQMYKMFGNSIIVQCMRFLKKLEYLALL